MRSFDAGIIFVVENCGGFGVRRYGASLGGAKTLKLLHFTSFYAWVGQKHLNRSSLSIFHVSNA
jgi:hypothetical protein